MTANEITAQIDPSHSVDVGARFGPSRVGMIFGAGKRSTRAIVAILLLFGLRAPAWAQTVMPSPYQTLLDNSGNVVNNGCIWTYVAGTTTAATTYSDVALTTPNLNPIRSDSAGRFVAFLPTGQSFKFTYELACTPPAHGTVLKTVDNVSTVPASTVNLDVTGTAGEALSAGNVVYVSDGSGGKTAGSWYKADSGNTYSSLTNPVGFAVNAIGSGLTGSIRLSGQVTGLSSLLVGTTYYVSTAGATTSSPPTFRRALGVADTTSSLVLVPWQLQTPPVGPGVPQGRLTLTTATPVTTANVTAASTVYYTPYTGNEIRLYDGTATWVPRLFSELSIALSGLVNAQAYDVFAYDNAGAVALETAEWANATNTMTIASPCVVTWTAHGMTTGQSITFTTTGALPTGVSANTQYWITTVDANTFKLSTSPANVAAGTFINSSGTQSGTHTGHQPQARQTAIALQNGAYVKSGTTTRRYLGTFLTTATSTTEDSTTKRYLWNYYNRVRRALYVAEATASWAYTLATWRQANAAATNQVEVVVGVVEAALELQLHTFFGSSATNTPVGFNIGEDSTNTPLVMQGGTGWSPPTTNTAIEGVARMGWRYPSVGRHFYAWLEWSTATGTTTWYGATGVSAAAVAGMIGSIDG